VSVKRYSDALCGVVDAAEGEYVLHADYERDTVAMREERDALAAALRRVAQNWGWWNAERPPIVACLPSHAAVEAVIAEVEREERAKYARALLSKDGEVRA
jgi:hypothetical protein